MTGEGGILQFSQLDTPDPQSGYTLDDNARALMVSLHMNNGYEYACRYSSYLREARRMDGSWSNFALGDDFSSSFNSEDSIGRAILACSLAVSAPWPDIGKSCADMVLDKLPQVLNFSSPRAIAYTVIALCKSELPGISSQKRLEIISRLVDQLSALYKNYHGSGWYWFENYLTYCNGILPQAMLAAYTVTGDKSQLKIGHDSLNFLNGILFREGFLNIIGNRGWFHRDGKISRFDQQPVDAASTVYANFEAYQTIGETEYLEMAALAHQWYRGRNVHGLSLYDPQTGGCYDALTMEGVNLNQGAEAVLSLLLSDILMESFISSEVKIDQSS